MVVVKMVFVVMVVMKVVGDGSGGGGGSYWWLAAFLLVVGGVVFPFLAHHDGFELLVVDCAGSVLVNLVDHFVDVSLRHRLVQRQQDLLQHLSIDRTFALLVEDSKSLSDLLLLLCFFGLLGHEDQKLIKVDESRSVAVNLLDALLELIGLELMPQHSHDGTQLGGGDFASSLLVDSLESILEVCDERVRQLVLGLFVFVTHDDV